VKRLLAIFLLTVLASADEPQVWTSREGKTFTGDFLATRPGKVYVRGKDKKIFAIPMAKLTDACLAEAAYLQEKLGAWAQSQVQRRAMDEATAWAVLMLSPEAIDGKVFLIEAKVEEIVQAKPNRPEKGSKVRFKTESGIECQADFQARGEIVIKEDAVYADTPAGAPAEQVNSRNSDMVLMVRQAVPVQVKVMKGKIVGGFTASAEELAKAREADGKVVEYEAEIVRQRIAVIDEQIRSGLAVSGGSEISGADGKPITVPPDRFNDREIETMQAELSWLRTKIPMSTPGG
jgi:hypothetical protein